MSRIEDDLTAGGLVQFQNGTTGGSLAAAGLANDAQCLASHQLEGHIVNRNQFLGYLAGEGLLDGEALAQMAHFQNALRINGLGAVGFDLCLALFEKLRFQRRVIVHGSHSFQYFFISHG